MLVNLNANHLSSQSYDQAGPSSYPMAFLLPTLLFLLAFTYLPIGLSLLEGIPSLHILLQPDNLNAFRVTLIYTLLVTPLSAALGLAAALATEGEGRWRKALRALIVHPVLLPGVAFAAVFLYLLNPLGPLSGLIQSLGWQNPLGTPTSAFIVVLLVGVLKNMGLYMLYYLAGLQNIPQELLEAARVDGAGPWTSFVRITLPLLSPTTFFVGVMATLGALNNIDQVFVLTQGGPLGATDLLLYRIYRVGFEYFNFHQASALSLALFLALTTLALLALPRFEQRVHYER